MQRWWWLAVALAACSGTGTAAGQDGGDTAAGTDASATTDSAAAAEVAPAADASGDSTTAALHGVAIFDWYNGKPKVPIQNAQVHLGDGPVAADTDGKGAFSLEAPVAQPLLVRLPLPGQLSLQRLVTLPAGGATIALHIMDIDKYVGSVAHVGSNSTAFDTGAVAVRFLGAAQPGYGATLSLAHSGSFVLNGNGQAQSAATTQLPNDTVYFFNVEPGAAVLSLSVPAGAAPCVDALSPATASYPVAAGTFTEVVLECAAKP